LEDNVVLMFERAKPRRQESLEPFDSYFAMFGVRMTLPDLLEIRENEDYMIELEHISEEDRVPVPAYLVEEWQSYLRSRPEA
jgi:hypothetical protein